MAILMAMSSYSVAEAKNNLPRLLDRMLAGEAVTITRRGKPIARLEPAEPPARTNGAVDLEWLEKVRVSPSEPIDSVTLVRKMRDGEI
ncbi:type II toxin-antitoxin system prevent-host-death family antitoxin [Brevundimonas sp. S30B]|uniref:type II toxin-antitoxin system Phd/YefM family antitoxin n=1 Tax=unclassified Brevundimonas TaxID=2622653 RepID=UPI0010723692|nr:MULTISPECIES: type II toxin-antitoxin system prevent-host-death family antitoxin [unclassified Brevundimonas]QBX36313.1 type II toxin-antitoxin system prevent-host-death family antitoxin [Brevundimonas sp. MF30-B]TFW01022.1 type II toxin-antitoxin system prevent-host-death family antitoxin [Brevundimonas sp. S30B]